MAIMNGHLDLAKELVDRGADPNLADELGLTALYETVDVHWAPKSWFPQPVTAQEKVGYLDLMKDLLDHGANPNARLGRKLWFRSMGDRTWVDPAGATALWRAAVALDIPAMRVLVRHGADPELPTKGGDTLLMVTSGLGWGANFSTNVADGWMEAVKYSLELGGDVNAKDARGYSALHGAAYIGNNDLVNFLVSKGADVKAVATDKNTRRRHGRMDLNRYGMPCSAHPETVALLEKLGSANSNNCRSDQCLVAARDDSKGGGGGRGGERRRPWRWQRWGGEQREGRRGKQGRSTPAAKADEIGRAPRKLSPRLSPILTNGYGLYGRVRSDRLLRCARPVLRPDLRRQSSERSPGYSIRARTLRRSGSETESETPKRSCPVGIPPRRS